MKCIKRLFKKKVSSGVTGVIRPVAIGGSSAALVGLLMWVGSMIDDRTPDSDNPVLTHSEREYPFRSLNNVDSVGVHHTVEYKGADFVAELHVKNNKWPGPGYHYYFPKEGRAIPLNDIDRRTNGIKNHNTHTIHLAFEGDMTKGPPTEQQVEAFRITAASLMVAVPGIKKFVGHGKFPGAATACPGSYLDPVIAQVNQELGL